MNSKTAEGTIVQITSKPWLPWENRTLSSGLMVAAAGDNLGHPDAAGAGMTKGGGVGLTAAGGAAAAAEEGGRTGVYRDG